MAKGKRKVVWFNLELEKELLQHAEAKNNFSEYVKRLIRDDLHFEQSGIDPKLLEYLDNLLVSRLAGLISVDIKTSFNSGENDSKKLDNVFAYF